MSRELGKQPVVILGMFRSGTSCVATCFTKLGYYFGGEDELFPADEFNPGGYHEIHDLMKLNRKILGAFGMQHFRIEEIPDHWQTLPGMNPLLSELEGLLIRKLGGRERWGWKEPQTSVLMPLYRELFRRLDLDPLYVICVRNPIDVCASQRIHSPLPHLGERVVGLWLHYTLSALRETKGANRTVIHYDSLVADPGTILSSANQLLGSGASSESDLAAAVAAVRPEWRHNNRSEQDLKNWPEIVQETYSLAKRCAVDTNGFRDGQYDQEIERLWLSWRRHREMVKTNALPNGRLMVTWFDSNGPVQREETLVPNGNWQTMRVEIQAPKGGQLRIDPYQTPCLCWIRKANLICEGQTIPADLKPGRTGMLSPVEGLRRLVVWGPDPLIVQLPDRAIQAIEMEYLVEANINSLQEVVKVLHANLEYVVKKLQAPRRA